MSKISITEEWTELKNTKDNVNQQLSILKRSKETRENVKQLIENYITEAGLHFMGSRDEFISSKIKEMLEFGYITLEYPHTNEFVYLSYFLK